MFFKLKTNNSELIKKIDRSKKYSVYEAVELISVLDNNFKDEDKSADLTVLIWDENQQISSDTISLGKGEGVDYLIYLEKRLLQLHKDDNDFENRKIEIDVFINSLQNIYTEQYNATLLPEIETEKKPKKSYRFSGKLTKNVKITVIALSFVAVLVIGYLALKSSTDKSIAIENEESISQNFEGNSLSEESHYDLTYLNQLLTEKRFEEALKDYPQEYPYIEREIFYLGIEGIPYLETFLAEKPDYLKGHFDLAYLKKDFVKVVELKSEADSDERLTQLTVAYINLNQLSEAEELNETLQVTKLTEQIQTAKNRNLINSIKEGRLDEAKADQVALQNPLVEEYFKLFDESSQQLIVLEEQLLQENLNEEEIELLNKEKESIQNEMNNFFYLF
ncbi:hypothetical protein FEZ33_00430 [Ruoffia tabacinasalis]|uniref:Uncharacterized protein n=1 Tax=Ruoffia tabacinasalis TaxID=87458 RepID=A0A5R9EPP2_9LACT|nr:hypothetical protein [Ruoffia tabacinasalis]TLQ49488.1 hypothetical protein FEZ33_00430 [Ruoffia tabacinasalis]